MQMVKLCVLHMDKNMMPIVINYSIRNTIIHYYNPIIYMELQLQESSPSNLRVYTVFILSLFANLKQEFQFTVQTALQKYFVLVNSFNQQNYTLIF